MEEFWNVIRLNTSLWASFIKLFFHNYKPNLFLILLDWSPSP